MRTRTHLESSWIYSVTYEPTGDGRGVLTVVTYSGPVKGRVMMAQSPRDRRTYRYSVPSWLPGLLHATGSLGVGFNRFVRSGEYAVRIVEPPAPEPDVDLVPLLRESIRRAEAGR